MKKIILAIIISISAPQCVFAMEHQPSKKVINWELLNGKRTQNKAIITYARMARWHLNSKLYNAVYDSNLKKIQETLDEGAIPHSFPTSYKPELHIAIGSGWGNVSEKICALLLAHGADPDFQDIHGKTALMNLCDTYYFKQACPLFFNAKADLSIKDYKGNTVLHHAACLEDAIKHENICAVLVEHQKERNRGIITALLYFKKKYRIIYQIRSLMKPYLEAQTLKALLNAKNDEGKTAWDYWPVTWLRPVFTNPGLPARQASSGL